MKRYLTENFPISSGVQIRQWERPPRARTKLARCMEAASSLNFATTLVVRPEVWLVIGSDYGAPAPTPHLASCLESGN